MSFKMEPGKAFVAAGSDSSGVMPSVMDEYFEMFSCQQFHGNFGEHSVVDWFGRRVRGIGRIQSFLKYEVWSQYEQKIISEPEECEPFEANPIHFQTQKPLEKNRKKPDRISRLNLLGVLPMKRKADSDIDSEDEMRGNSGYKTPERSIVPLEAAAAAAGHLTPPPSSNKNDLQLVSIETDSEVDLDASEADEEKQNNLKQSLKRARSRSSSRSQSHSQSLSRSFHYLQHFPRKMRKHNNHSVTKTFNDSDDDFVSLESSSDEETEKEIPKEIDYSPLKYTRVTAMLEAKTNLYVSSNSLKHTDSPIRINISYRRHLKTNSLQIALVLYEKLDGNRQAIGNSRLLKRTLFDFGGVDADKVNQQDEDNTNGDDDDGDGDVDNETKETNKFFNLETANDASQEITSIANEITLAELPNRERRDSSLPFEDDEEAISSSSTLVNVSERSSDTASLTSIEADTDSLTAINPVTDSLAWLNPFNSTNPMNISSSFNTTTPAAPSSPTSTNLMMDSLDSTNLNNVTSSLRTPSKTNGPPSTPKRKSKAPKSVPISVLKRLQESSISLKPPPKSTAARCLRL